MNIPNFCYSLDCTSINPKTKIGKIIKVVALETGFYRTSFEGTQEEVDEMNDFSRYEI